MPPDRPPLDASQTSRKQWIEEGAEWPKESKLEVQTRIDFARTVQPILEMNCLSCHSEENAEGDFDLVDPQGGILKWTIRRRLFVRSGENSNLFR